MSAEETPTTFRFRLEEMWMDAQARLRAIRIAGQGGFSGGPPPASELTGGTFNLAALQQMSRNDYHLSDEESSVGTHRDFMWGIVMGYFLGGTSLCCLWHRQFPHKCKVGILIGVILQIFSGLIQSAGDTNQNQNQNSSSGPAVATISDPTAPITIGSPSSSSGIGSGASGWGGGGVGSGSGTSSVGGVDVGLGVDPSVTSMGWIPIPSPASLAVLATNITAAIVPSSSSSSSPSSSSSLLSSSSSLLSVETASQTISALSATPSSLLLSCSSTVIISLLSNLYTSLSSCSRSTLSFFAFPSISSFLTSSLPSSILSFFSPSPSSPPTVTPHTPSERSSSNTLNSSLRPVDSAVIEVKSEAVQLGDTWHFISPVNAQSDEHSTHHLRGSHYTQPLK